VKTRHIDIWNERCHKNEDHNGIVTNAMIQARMQEEIDELRCVYDCARTLVTVRGKLNREQALKRLEECLSNNDAIGDAYDTIQKETHSN